MARVLIGIPIRHVYGSPSPKTQACIDRLRATTPHATELRLVRGQQISQNSFTLCQQFLDEGWDYLLYTGDDIIFPPWALDRLIAHDKDFMSGVCTWKTPPYMVPLGMQGEDGTFRHILIRPEHVRNSAVLEVDGTGSGFILMKRAVLERVWQYMSKEVFPSIPKKYRWLSPIPFFPAVRDPENGEIFSSDFAFARLAKESGSRIFVDCGLICRHRWEGEVDITHHWAWLDKYGFQRQEEQYFGDQLEYAPVDENRIFWGEAGPPVPITATSTGNRYHLDGHIQPVLGCISEQINETEPVKTDVGYVIGWHVSDDDSWQVYSAWCARFKRVLVQWVGSDLTNIDSWMTPERMAHLNHPRFVHLVEDDRLVPEAKQYFENVKVCPLPTINILPVTPLPKDFSVAVYYPKHRHDFHYGDVLKEVIEKMPDTMFFLYHLFGQKPDFSYPNVVWLGSLPPEGYAELMQNTACMLRLSKHDGRPYSIVEAGIAGRRFVTNFDMPFTHRVPDVPTADDVVKALTEIRAETTPDEKASRHYLKENDHLLFKARIRKLGGMRETATGPTYNYTHYWDNRYEKDDVAGAKKNAPLDDEVNKLILDAAGNGKPMSILEIGCGTANRWKSLPGKDYVGVDVSPTAVRRASEIHPDGRFFVADLARDPLPQSDVVLALSVLPHIRPTEFDSVWKKITKAAKKKIIATVTFGTGNGQYQFDLPPVETWDLDGWTYEMSDLSGSSKAKLLVFTKEKETSHA